MKEITTPEPKPHASEPNQNKPENLLDLNKYQALYGRLFLAARNNTEISVPQTDLLDPEKQLSRTEIDDIQSYNWRAQRGKAGYNHITNGLSMSERTEVWNGKSFDEAYALWSGSLLSSIHLSESRERKDVVHLFTGKDHSSINDQDIQNLYDKYCRNGSNVNSFAKKALENLGNMEDIEWLAKKLFGKNTSAVVSRIIELEDTSRKSPNKANLRSLLLTDLNRLNSPNEDEKTLLNLLSTNYKKLETNSSPKPNNTQEPDQIPTKRARPAPSEVKSVKEQDKQKDLLFIRSRIILTDRKSGLRYYVNILDEYAHGDKKEGDRLLTLKPITDGEETVKMTKLELLEEIKGNNSQYDFDPLEKNEARLKSAEGDRIYYLRTYYQPRDIDERNQGEYIRFFNNFEDKNGDNVMEIPRDEFEERLVKGGLH